MNNSQISMGNDEVKIFFIDWTLENIADKFCSRSAEVFINPNCALHLDFNNFTLNSIEARIKWNNFLKIKKVHFKVSVLDSECNVLETIFVDSFRSVKLENGQEIVIDRVFLLELPSFVIQSIRMRCELCIHIERWSFSLENCKSQSATLQNGPHSFSILSEDMKHFLKEDNFADMSVKVSGKIVKLHKALLQCRCPSFLTFLEMNPVDKLKSPLEDNLSSLQTKQKSDQRYFNHFEAFQNDVTFPQSSSHAVTSNRCEESEVNAETLIHSQEKPSYVDVELMLSQNSTNAGEAVKESNVSNGTLIHFFNPSTAVSNEHESIHSDEENEVLCDEKCAPISENLSVDVSTDESSLCNDIKCSDTNMKKMKDMRIHLPSIDHASAPDSFQIDTSESMECLKPDENAVSQCTEGTQVSLQTKESTKFKTTLEDCKLLKVAEINVTNTSYDNPEFENITSVSIQNSECNLYSSQSTEHLNAEKLTPSDNNKYETKHFSDNFLESKLDSEDEGGSLFISCSKSNDTYDVQFFPLEEGTVRKTVSSKCTESVQESHICSPINPPNLSNNEEIKFDQQRSTMLIESTQESVPCNELESNVKLHQTSNSVCTESKQKLHSLEDVDYEVFLSIMNYLYSGSIEEMKCETECLFWSHVHAFSNKFGLTNLCRQLAATKIEVSTRPSVNLNYSLIWPLDNFDFSSKCTALWSPFYELSVLRESFRWNLALLVKDLLISIQLKFENQSSSTYHWPSCYGRCTISITSKRKNEEINLKQKSTSWDATGTIQDPEPLNFDFSPYLINTNSFVFDLITIQCDVEIYSCLTDKYKVEAYIPMPSAITFSDPLSRDLGSLLETGTFSDFRIQTSNKAFHVHKFLLSARSPTFSQILKASDRQEIHIQNMHDTTVEKLLQYIYTGRVTDAEKLDRDLYEAAGYYKLPDLQNQCRQQIVKQLDNANACNLLVVAHSLQDEILKKLVEEYLMQHVSDVFLTDSGISFMKHQPDLASGIFRQLSFAYKNQRSK